MNREFEICYKPKRIEHPAYDEVYSNFIKEIASSENRFRIESVSTNLFDLINAVDVIICIPFSSPAYLAALQDKQAIYYDPTSDLVFKSQLDKVYFCNNSRMLRTNLSKIFHSFT